MSLVRTGAAIAVCGLLASYATQSPAADRAGSQDKIFETNVTNDLDIASGEPEIAVDPTNPRHLAILEFSVGSAKVPAWSRNPVIFVKTPEEADAAMEHNGRLMLSHDGGDTWTAHPAPATDADHSPGGGDPMIAYGPDGAIYAADSPFPKIPSQRGDISQYTFVIAASTDGGKTFGKAQYVGSPVDRAWLKVDQSTGMVFTASTGPYNPQTKVRNKKVEGAIEDRWLVAWTPHLAAHSEPRRMGGPDFSAAGGSTMSAAHGVIASTFMIGAPAPGAGPLTAPVPIPASLKDLVKDGTQSCSMQEPCLFFQTSSDEGRHWTRRHVPVPGGFSGFVAYVAADPGRPGRYAIGVLNRQATALRALVTDDSGVTWSAPVTVVEAPPRAAPGGREDLSTFAVLNRGTILRPWMDYGPTGVLGFIWRQRRDDLQGNTPLSSTPGMSTGPGFDVYAGLSCDGGKTWLPPVKVNAEPSPPGPTAFDDLSYIALDARYAHLVWGDRRNITKVHNAPTGIGGVQAYYGRVPFSAASGGAPCGRP